MLFESHESDLQKKLFILTSQIEEDQNKDTESNDFKNNINVGSVPQKMQIAADEHTPPPQQAETRGLTESKVMVHQAGYSPVVLEEALFYNEAPVNKNFSKKRQAPRPNARFPVRVWLVLPQAGLSLLLWLLLRLCCCYYDYADSWFPHRARKTY